MTLVSASFALCAIGYLVLAAMVGWRRPRNPADGILLVAAALTGIWAIVAVGLLGAGIAMPEGRLPFATFRVLETLSNVAWLLFLVELVLPGVRQDGRARYWTSLRLLGVGMLLVPMAAVVALGYLGTAFWIQAIFVCHILSALVGLALVENMLRGTTREGFWAVKYLGIGLGGLYVFDFVLYADALLFHALDGALFLVRGPIVLAILPLIVVGIRRNAAPREALFISRSVVFHTTTAMVGGVYLIGLAAAGYFLQQLGGSSGELFIALLLFVALLLLIVLLASRQLRSRLAVLLNKNFYRHKYDYRNEWSRFIDKIAGGPTSGDLRAKVIEALADIVDSPGGVLWEWSDVAQSYELTAEWNCAGVPSNSGLDPALVGFVVTSGWIVDLNEVRAGVGNCKSIKLEGWLAADRAFWIALPVQHGVCGRGIVLLQQPRAARDLNWEDHDLLKMSGRQAATYLAESAAARELHDGREIQLFNNRFSFVVHDTKTLISQMSLMLRNAQVHGDDPAFLKELISSIGDSVETMRRFLEQLNAERRRPGESSNVDLAAVARRIAQRCHASDQATIHIVVGDEPLIVRGDAFRVSIVVGHLVQNAIDAAGKDGRVTLNLDRVDDMAVVDVIDDGAGMALEFVRDGLFRPLRSTKSTGYGIGAYQCRELVRELGGRIKVSSVAGAGTTMHVALPLASGALALEQATA